MDETSGTDNVVAAAETLDEQKTDLGGPDPAAAAGETPARDFPSTVDAGSGTVTVGKTDDGLTSVTVEHPEFEGEKNVKVYDGENLVGDWHFSGKDTPKTVTVDAADVQVKVTVGDTVIAEH